MLHVIPLLAKGMTDWRFFGGDVAVVRCGDVVVKLRNSEVSKTKLPLIIMNHG